VHESPPVSKSRERQQARQSATRKDSSKAGREARVEETSRAEPEGSARRLPPRGQQEERAVRSRDRQEEPRTVSRPVPAAGDDEGYILVRPQRTRDGRRVIVSEKPVEEESKAAVPEEAPRPPFTFNPAGTGGF
jgi:hypothetical protein